MIERLTLSSEQNLFDRGYAAVIGVDEAGRGPLAGPVVAAAVALGAEFSLADGFRWVRDSKTLSESQREAAYTELASDRRIAYAVSAVSPAAIDALNIHNATLKAMGQAVRQLMRGRDSGTMYCLIDGRFTIQGVRIGQRAVIDGDAKIFSIAAASIFAKVTRDRLMHKFHKKYPRYNFAQHKGYGTEEHRAALAKYGACPLHRQSFLSRIPCAEGESAI